MALNVRCKKGCHKTSYGILDTKLSDLQGPCERCYFRLWGVKRLMLRLAYCGRRGA
jgi:hypothetical protein